MNQLIPWKRSDRQRNGEFQMAPVTQMRSDWDRMFDRLLDDMWGPTPSSSGMLLDVTETDDDIRIRVEVPGIAPEALDISLAGELLTLSGEKTDEEQGQHGKRTYSERHFGAFQRTIKLSCPVDPDKVKAEHRNGVVTITLQKAETVRPKRIKIKTA